jgi:hypothetical protein
MGKYTSLAHKYEEAELQGRGGKATVRNDYVKINIINKETNPPSEPLPVEPGTPLRPYAVNAVIRCIHGKARDECAVCSGYARWLIAGGRADRKGASEPGSRPAGVLAGRIGGAGVIGARPPRVTVEQVRSGRYSLEVLACAVTAALGRSAYDGEVVDEVTNVLVSLGYGAGGVAAVWV